MLRFNFTVTDIIEDFIPFEEVWVCYHFSLIFIQSCASILIGVQFVEYSFQLASINVIIASLKCIPVTHKLRHDKAHIIKWNDSILIFIKQWKTEFIFLIFCSVLIDVKYGRKLLKSDMLILILINHTKYSIAQKWIASLAQEAKEYSKLILMHQPCFSKLLNMLLG